MATTLPFPMLPTAELSSFKPCLRYGVSGEEAAVPSCPLETLMRHATPEHNNRTRAL